MFLLTIKTNWAFFLLFFFLDMAFLLLAVGHFEEPALGKVNEALIKAGGFFGLLAAFLAWYNAIAGIANESNSFFRFPLGPLPWANAGRSKAERDMV